LLEQSRCAPVHDFAARALRDCPEFCRGLDLPVLKVLAASPYRRTARLGMDLVLARFDPARPDPELVLVLADSALEEARRQAREGGGDQWAVLGGSSTFVAGLAASPQAETRAFAREQLRQTAISDAEAQSLVARLVAVLHGLGAGEGPRAADIGETM